MNRYKSATTEEKANFAKISKLVKAHTSFKERVKMLIGEKSWIKYVIALKANNPHIHALEVGIKKGEIANVRLVVSKPTVKSDFHTQMVKFGFKATYGGTVLHIDCEEKDLEKIFTKIESLAQASEEIELDPKRTYCDPPAGWIEGLTGKEGVIKKEDKKKEEEVVTPTPEVVIPEEAPKAEEAA